MIMWKRIPVAFSTMLAGAIMLTLPAAEASNLTQTNTTSCVNLEGITNCEQKIMLNADVSYGASTNVDVAYIDTVTTASGTTTSLEETLTFNITKSQPQWRYSLSAVDLIGSAHPGYPFTSYTINAPVQDYSISTKIMKGSTLFESIVVSPDQPLGQITNGHNVFMTLLGTKTSAAPAPDFSSNILFVWQGHALLVPRALLPASTSLNVAQAYNSLLQRLYTADTALLSANPDAETNYLVDGMQVFQGSWAADHALGVTQLRVPVTTLNYSTISLELDNAQVGLYSVESVGYMPSAYVGNFSSMTKNGRVHVQVKNQGSVTSDYNVIVRDCYPSIGKVAPMVLTLAAGAQTEVVATVPTTASLAASHYCWIDLQSARGTQFDSVQVYFDTTTAPAD
jgi:hypothetical protein